MLILRYAIWFAMDQHAQPLEGAPTWRATVDIRELPTSFDKLDDDLPSIDTVPEEVELDIDVLTLVVENRILRKDDGGLIVHHQCWWVSFHTG